jgi:predicted ATPase
LITFVGTIPNRLNPKKIVITGGPSTGKTSLIERLGKEGYHCFPEVIRSMTLDAKNEAGLSGFTTNPIAVVRDPLGFNRKIMEARMRHFEESTAMAEPLVFFDRGLPDVLAYMDYFDQEYGPEFIDALESYRYDSIFLLPMWQEIYTSDSERFESYEEAMEIHRQLHLTYTRFGYRVVEVPKDTIARRVAFIKDQLVREK